MLTAIDIAECRLALDAAGKQHLSVAARRYNFTDIPLLHIVDRDGNSLTSYFWYEDEPQGWLSPDDSKRVMINVGAKGKVSLALPPDAKLLPRPVDVVHHWLNETKQTEHPPRKENRFMRVLKGIIKVVRVVAILNTWGWGLAAIVFGIKLVAGSTTMETAVGVAIVAMTMFAFEIWSRFCDLKDDTE